MNDIKAKLDLLELSEKERKIVYEKFLVSLAIVDYEEMKKIIDFLKLKGIYITKARELKILCNDYNEIIKNFNIIESIDELGIYKEDPTRINKNALDIFKKIKYCTQIGKAYKKENDTYEKFLFSEVEWQKVFNKDSESVTLDTTSVDVAKDVTIDTMVPPVEEVKEETLTNDEATNFELIDNSINELYKERKDLEDLKAKLAGLGDIDNQNYSDDISFDEINFNTMTSIDDIKPEEYNETRSNSYRRAA